MVRKALKKLFRRSSKEQKPEQQIEDVRADGKDPLRGLDELNPSHSDQAAQIGMFS